MKIKKTAIIILTVTSLLGYSQFKTVKITKSELIGKVNSISLKKNRDTYTLSYLDAKYTHISQYKAFQFKDVDNTFENLYNAIVEGFKNPPEEATVLVFPDDTILLNPYEVMGRTVLEMQHAINHNPKTMGIISYLNAKDVNKLFGKKKPKETSIDDFDDGFFD